MMNADTICLSKFGMPTLIELGSLQDQIKLCKDLSLGFVELNCNIPQYSPYELDPQLLNKMSSKYGIEFTLHLPEELDVSSFHVPVREGHLRYCKYSMEWAAKVGISLLNMHLNKGTYFTLPYEKVWLYEKYMDRYIHSISESYRQIDSIAYEHGIMVCVENTGDFDLPFLRKVLPMILSNNSIYLTWDIGHDASAKYCDKEIMLENQNKIRHMHLHDADDDKSHLPLFTGKINIYESIAFAAKHNLRIVIETKTISALEESVRMIKKYILKDECGS